MQKIYSKTDTFRLPHVWITSKQDLQIKNSYKKQMFVKVLLPFDSLEDKTKVDDKFLSKPPEEGENLFTGNTSESDNEKAFDGLPTSSPNMSHSGAFVTKSVRVFQRGSKFSGNRKGLSVQAFLQKVNELYEARGVTKGKVLRSDTDLFEVKALIWYRAVKDRNCWLF